MSYFDHEKLIVYQKAKEFVVLSDVVMKLLPRGRAYLVDQFQRASLSILLNIAEGAGEFSSNEKIRFYRMARRSASECSAILELAMQLKLFSEENYSKARNLLIEIVSILSKMVHVSDHLEELAKTKMKREERGEDRKDED